MYFTYLVMNDSFNKCFTELFELEIPINQNKST